MDSDANHTIRDILLPSVNKVGCVVVQTCPVSFAPGIVVGAHVKYLVYRYRQPPLEGTGMGIGGVAFSLPLPIAKKNYCKVLHMVVMGGGWFCISTNSYTRNRISTIFR